MTWLPVRLFLVWFAILCVHSSEGSGWPTFHADNQRTGRTGVEFAGPRLERIWTFDLGEHTWSYKRGVSVWSSCAVFGEVKDRTRVLVGAYDHNLYCLDAVTGKQEWRFTTGGVLNAAPAFARVRDRAVVFMGSGDRTLYAVDAATGRKIWSYETLPWSYTVAESSPSAPLVAVLDRRTVVCIAFWNTDHRPVRALEFGAAYAFDAASGELIWTSKRMPNPLSTPSLSVVGERALLFFGSEDGCAYALDARTGEIVWKTVLGHSISATPTVARLDGQPVVIVGDFFGMIWCLRAGSGEVLWQYKTGHQITSTAAVLRGNGSGVLYVGSLDRCLHAVDMRTHKLLWKFATGKYITASPATALIGGRPTVFISSLDNCLYAVDAATGGEAWRFEAGDMLWSYETRGSSLWSSPSVDRAGGKPLLVFPAYDGKLYAFSDREGASALLAARDQEGEPRDSRNKREWGFAMAIPLFVGSGFVLAGVAVVLVARRRSV